MNNDFENETYSTEYIEIKEKTLDDAITSACQKLMVTSDRLDYVVVDQGSNGFLGFNARPAIIKARVKLAQAEAVLNEVLERAENKVSSVVSEVKEENRETVKDTAEAVKEAAEETSEAAEEAIEEAETAAETVQEAEASAAVKEEARPVQAGSRRKKEERPLTEEEVSRAKDKADDFLTQVFGAMGLDAEIRASYDKTDNILSLDISGDDMGMLIGKRGQTLDSLQYLVSLVVNKDTSNYVHVKCDTENYRDRRKKTLENLAKNVAQKVKRTRQNVVLEPMNPYERRIIHSALQNDKYVTTYSEGEEPYRKVVVTMKK